MNVKNIQPILGTDKNDPLFYICSSDDGSSVIDVYFGLALLEKVNNDGKSIRFKMLVGRLYNARMKVSSLEKTFSLPRSTIMRWGNALHCDDEEMVRRLSSSGAPQKITTEIQKYIQTEFVRIYQDNRCNYNFLIRQGVDRIFDVSISAESIRKIVREERLRIDGKLLDDSVSSTTSAEPQVSLVNISHEGVLQHVNSPSKEGHVEAGSCVSETILRSEVVPIRNHSLRECDDPEDSAEPRLEIFRPFADLEPGVKKFGHHVGLLLALPRIQRFQTIEQKIVLQWLSTILLSSTNIEQTARIDLKSLEELLLNPVLTTAKAQRSALKRVCSSENIHKILQANIAFCQASKSDIYYYDPHSMPYTGMENILKGWCGSLGKITKVNYHDFIHTAEGQPVWISPFDNYLDLRDRFLQVATDFAESMNKNPEMMTFIIDRGIYGKKVMEAVHKAKFGLVTWQKDCKDKSWDSNIKSARLTITRRRNSSRDIKRWQFEYYCDSSWEYIEGFRRLVVKVLAPNAKRPVILAILTNGKCPDERAVLGMFNRWIQENDFAYLIKHYGINEITSYEHEDYSQLKDELIEKEVDSTSYIITKRVIDALQNRLNTLLGKRDRLEQKKKKLSAKDNSKMDALRSQLLERKNELESITRKVNKHDKLVQQGKKRLKIAPKHFMDSIKISARNIFYSLANEFREIFDNYRNDHQILRELTHASGTVEQKNGVLLVTLTPARNFPKREFSLITEFLEQLNEKENTQKMGITYKLGSL